MNADFLKENLVYVVSFLVVSFGTILYIINTFLVKEDVSKGLEKELMSASDEENKTSEPVLHVVKFKKFKILRIDEAGVDIKQFRFEIPPEESIRESRSLGLTVGRHLTLCAHIDGTKVMRPYTPTSSPSQKGHFDLLIKSYEFGKLSTYLHSLRPGDEVEIRGPVGRFHYHANKHNKIGLIAAGTGITPCLQVIRSILENENDSTDLILYFQNRYVDQIPLKHVIDELIELHPSRLQVVYFASATPAPTSKSKNKSRSEVVYGYIAEDAVRLRLSPSECSLVCVCGPSGFNKMAVEILRKVGHTESNESEVGSIYIW